MTGRLIFGAVIGIASGMSFASTLRWNLPAEDSGPFTYAIGGMDVTVRVLDPDGVSITGPPTLPDDDSSFGCSGLWIAGTLATPHGASHVTGELTFSQPVSSMSFSVSDVDEASGTIDTVDVSWRPGTGPDTGPTSVGTGSEVLWDAVFGLSASSAFGSDPPRSETTASVQFDGLVDVVRVALSSNAKNRGSLLKDVSFVPVPGTVAVVSGVGVVFLRLRRGNGC